MLYRRKSLQLTMLLAALFIFVGSAFAQAQQVPLNPDRISQFIDPLPLLSVQTGSIIHTILALGGGLVRSQGGWSQVLSKRRGGGEKSDERILGSGDFVERIVAGAEEWQCRLLTWVSASKKKEVLSKVKSEAVFEGF